MARFDEALQKFVPVPIDFGPAPGYVGTDQVNAYLDPAVFLGLHGQAQVVLTVNDPEAKAKTAPGPSVEFR